MLKKVLLGCGVLLLIAGTFGYFVVQKFRTVAEGGAAYIEEGETFGASTDHRGCIDEAFRRGGDGMVDIIYDSLFANGCLSTAAASDPPLCEGVPPKSEFLKAAAWRLKFCEGRGLAADDQLCGRLAMVILEFCEED